jgi:hypothetical protein
LLLIGADLSNVFDDALNQLRPASRADAGRIADELLGKRNKGSSFAGGRWLDDLAGNGHYERGAEPRLFGVDACWTLFRRVPLPAGRLR